MSYEVLKAIAGKSGSVLVTVVAVRGSVPRHVGSKMAVLPDGSIVGTVGGGLLESRAIERAKGCIAASLSGSLEVELTRATPWGHPRLRRGRRIVDQYVADTSPFRAALSPAG